MVDGLGVTGVEGRLTMSVHWAPRQYFCVLGPYRIACEMAMRILRDNRDCLLSVLDSFVHDPLVEWEDEKRKLVSIFCKEGMDAL